MYALSVKQPYAEEIASGRKRIEYRTWKTNHRGPLLIVASKGAEEGGADLPRGVAICVVDVVKVTGEDGDYKWHLGKPRRVHPVQVTGYAALYTVPDQRVVLASSDAAPVIFALPPKKASAARTRPKRTRRETVLC